MIMTIKVLICFAFCLMGALALTCGGNCASNNCPSCVCGQTKSVINVTQYCAVNDWDQACCKCIVALQSKGNQNFMDHFDQDLFQKHMYLIGVLQINQDHAEQYCPGVSTEDLCKWQNNVKCAYGAYQASHWNYWPTEAKKCGCSLKEDQSGKLSKNLQTIQAISSAK